MKDDSASQQIELSPRLLIRAYCMGIFPMGDSHSSEIRWYDPDPRAILPLQLNIPKRLARTVRSGLFQTHVNTAFDQVIAACAEPTPERPSTWLTPTVMAAYMRLHKLGIAHSVETWREGKLVGGLYGVAIRGLFAGESMFSRERDASKVALVDLAQRLQRGDFVLWDTQFLTDHLAQFGAYEIPRDEYKQRLDDALQVQASFG